MASPGDSSTHLRQRPTVSAGEAAAPVGDSNSNDYNGHNPPDTTAATATNTLSDPWGNTSQSQSHSHSHSASVNTAATATGNETLPATAADTIGGKPAKRKKNRNRKRRLRQQSFLPSADNEERDGGAGEAAAEEIFPSESATAPDPDEVANVNASDLQQQQQQQQQRPQIQHHSSTASGGNKSLKSRRRRFSFRGLGRDLSSTSLESEALLDHRNQPTMRPRRDSRLGQSLKSSSLTTGTLRPDVARNYHSAGRDSQPDGGEDSDGTDVNDQTPLIRGQSGHGSVNNTQRYGTDTRSSQQPLGSRRRRLSVQTTSSQRSPRAPRSPTAVPDDRDYDINNPPSMPTSPKGGPDMGYDDAMVTGADFDFSLTRSVDNRLDAGPRDMIIDLDSPRRQSNNNNLSASFSPPRRTSQDANRRRRTVALPVEEDVCFPTDSHSEMAEDEPQTNRDDERRRRRHRRWPDLSVLEEWMREEKEDRHGDFRSKKISEPMLIEGRLRPQYQAWRREEDEAPYRFTYFNEEFQSTLHAQTISELGYAGGSFRELFVPDCPVLEDSSDDSDSDLESPDGEGVHYHGTNGAYNRANGSVDHGNHDSHDKPGSTKQPGSIISDAISMARGNSRDHTPAPSQPPQPSPKPKRYGPRPTFWLDVLCPTDAEMRVLAKAFGIHALTAEDIMMQEAREKVELFRNYYFINYRTFEQDPNSEDYLEPVNMYVVVFREGVLSFHFSQTPHPANVRRRIRQLMDYLLLSSDWISYALIDDITDVFGPLIQAIEDEVDEIDEVIMRMHSAVDHGTANSSNNKDSSSTNGADTPSLAPGEMLRRVGECRKKVMGMYRLLSNKADVVKGFAKRCNEHWEVAPKSEIGLYLGDIQDHILTMTSSLTYYETLLSRAHSNYLAQINILMNERQERTADVLGKLTVLGTIVLPLNIIGSLWGMNVKVPGQDVENLHWFYSTNLGLVEIMAETERSPYRNGVSGRSGPPKDHNEAASPAAQQRSGSQGDMTDVPPPSTASKPTSQIPKLAASSIPTPAVSASPSTNNSAFSSREPSPIRPSSLRAGASNSPSQLPSLSRNNSLDRSPPRSNPVGQSSNHTAAAVQQQQQQQQQQQTSSSFSSSSQSGKPPVLNPPATIEPSVNDSDPDKSNMAAWAASSRAEHESYLANTSSKRASPATNDENAKGDRSAPRAVNRGLGGASGAPLETVQETVSDQSTPSADTVLNNNNNNNPTFDESRLQKIEEDTTPKALKQIGAIESGSDSGGNKSSDQKEEQRRRTSSGGTQRDALIPKRSSTSLSGARGKPADGSARNMIVETETVSSIPQVSLSAATGDRGHSGRVDHQGPLRLKPSTETIRPKKDKKRPRKPAPLPNGAASSKADIFEAKVASAVDEADVSDSDETFVYESNPPDPYPVRSRYHSRTPSATSMASQADQFAAGRARPPMRDNNHSVSGKRSMKFTNNTYNSSVDGDVPDEGRSGPGRTDGASSHTPRHHHHVGRNGRTNTYTSLFDSDSPFPQAQSYIKSPRHFIGSGFRQSNKHPGSRGPMNYRTINKKNGDAFSYDFDAEGADDERTPLVGSPRMPRSRHGGRRPNSASLRQMEYMQRRHGWFSRYGVCIVISVLLFLVIVLGTTLIVAVTKPLQGVNVAAIQNVLASEQELMLDLNVLAVNPNLFPVTVDRMDINIFAKSRYVGTDSLWREYGAALYDNPRIDQSKKRAELARAARCVGVDCSKDNQPVRASDGVDHGTDPMPPGGSDPVGDPQTMLLGRVFRFDSSLAFEPSPWRHVASSSKGQIRLQRPGNKTEEGGTERWERVLQHPFDLIVRGVIKYQLPMSSRYVSSSISSSVKVTPDKDDNGDGHTHDPKPPKNDTVVMSVPSALLRRRLLLSRQLLSEQGALNTTQRTFTA